MVKIIALELGCMLLRSIVISATELINLLNYYGGHSISIQRNLKRDVFRIETWYMYEEWYDNISEKMLGL